ncbi:unnamed protein product [Sphagnum balticum]
MGIVRAMLKHPEDLPGLLKLKVASVAASRAIPSDPNLAFCFQMLRRVSHSLSLVIQQLSPDLRNAVCVFYLVLRALDIVENNTSIPVDVRVTILKEFHEKIYNSQVDFSLGKGGSNDCSLLMDKFQLVTFAFAGLSKGYQEVIAQISERIGTGMAKFITTEVETVSDYNEYCHYAAGLAGLGLSRLFYASGLEEFPPDILSNSMGLFIQKTNVTRDYLEDINKSSAPRMFWPREIWGKYVERLDDFKYDEYAEVAVECLNEMVTNALSHTVDCLQYMAALREMTNLRFCAMPQIMAMGTLAMCYNNIQVFRGVVKIRSGLMAQILEVKTMQDVYGAFFDFSRTLAAKIDKKDPSASLTRKYIEDLQTVCKAELGSRRIFAIESRGGHEACLGLALLVILVAMLLIVWR